MRDALEAPRLDVEKLTAPDGAIQAVARAIPGHAEIGSGDIVLGGAGATWAWWCCTLTSGRPEASAQRVEA